MLFRSPVFSINIYMSGSFKGVTKDWHFPDLRFDYPAELEGNFTEQGPNIEQALMIGHDNVGKVFVNLFLTFYR